MMEVKEKFLAAYDRYAAGIFRHIFFRVSDRNLAEDLTQETFFKTWRHIAEKGEEIKNFKTFLYVIANNLIIDYYRRKEKKPLALDDIKENEIASYPAQPIEAEKTLQKNLIRKYLSELENNYRQALLYHYVDELSVKEISEIVGKTPNNVRVIIHRGLKALKSKINV